jgi:methionine-rich copper-binding protein CopC
MRCLNRTLGLGALALVLGTVAGTSAAANATLHLALDKSSPEADAELSEAPDEVRLWFTQEPQAAGTSIRFMAADSSLVDLGDAKADPDDAKVFSAAVEGDLPPGGYTVIWRTMAADGHVIRGDFGFSVTGQDEH